MKKRVLFIDRDGTLLAEPPVDYQLDSLEKLEFIPGVFRNVGALRRTTDYELVIVSNQDGLGTPSFPEADFLAPHDKFLKAFENEGVVFDEVLIDPSLPEENSPNRKPATGMLKKYMQGEYDLENSFVIGDRLTDIELAKNLGAKGILFAEADKIKEIEAADLNSFCSLISNNWDDIYRTVRSALRKGIVKRSTKETSIEVEISLDGQGDAEIHTGLGFFDHMLEQIARHGNVDLRIQTNGDLEVDEHHTIEDTAIALGEACLQALGTKHGITRYGFMLPMDDCLAQAAIDFGGRPWLEWEADFKREMVGDMPTEMFYHFFKSFSDSARCNLNIKAEGTNEHHKIEAIFKAFSKALKGAVSLDANSEALPSTKGLL